MHADGDFAFKKCAAFSHVMFQTIHNRAEYFMKKDEKSYHKYNTSRTHYSVSIEYINQYEYFAVRFCKKITPYVVLKNKYFVD